MLHGVQGDHRPCQAQLGHPFQIFNSRIYVIYVDHSDSLEQFRVLEPQAGVGEVEVSKYPVAIGKPLVGIIFMDDKGSPVPELRLYPSLPDVRRLINMGV